MERLVGRRYEFDGLLQLRFCPGRGGWVRARALSRVEIFTSISKPANYVRDALVHGRMGSHAGAAVRPRLVDFVNSDLALNAVYPGLAAMPLGAFPVRPRRRGTGRCIVIVGWIGVCLGVSCFELSEGHRLISSIEQGTEGDE